MPEPTRPDWSERFLTGLQPQTERGFTRTIAVLLLLMAWVVGIMTGMALTTHCVATRSASDAERLLIDLPQRPSVHQRLDGLEERVRILEQRLAP